MSKEEYLALIVARYDELQGLQKHEDFYSYEEFVNIWPDLGRQVLKGTISQVPRNHQKNFVRTQYGKIAMDKSHVFSEPVLLQEPVPICRVSWCYYAVSRCLEQYLL